MIENLLIAVRLLLLDLTAARDDKGSVAAEYSVLLSLILGTVLVTVLVLGTTITARRAGWWSHRLSASPRCPRTP